MLSMKATDHHSPSVADAPLPDRGPRSEYLVTERPLRDAAAGGDHLVFAPGWLSGEESAAATLVTLSRRDGKPVARAVVTPADESTTLRRLELPAGAVSKCAFVSDVALEPDAPADLRAALFYLCARRARIWDKVVLVAALAKDASPDSGSDVIALEPLQRIKPFELHGRSWALSAQRVDIAVHRAWTAAPALQPTLQEQFVGEAVETLERWIGRFFQNSWFRAVREGTLTKEQYIYTLANLHQFVRWTTRHIGRAVGCSHDRAIRNKWLSHLREEVDHEIIIEKDLAALGADVDYVVRSMVPSLENHVFVAIQEASVAFHADPVLIMASPFVAEGFAAHLDQNFVTALRSTAKSWGIENPKQVTAFLCSHIEFDGGDDGHWDQTRRMLGEYLRTEEQFARFMNVVKICANAFDRSYSAYVDDLAIFSAASPGAP